MSKANIWFCFITFLLFHSVLCSNKLKEIQTADGKIYVAKRFCARQCSTQLSEFLTSFARSWDFNYDEKDTGKLKNRWNYHWVHPLPYANIHQWSITKQIKALVKTLSKEEYDLAESFGTLLRFGDTPNVIQGSTEDSKDLYIMVHLSQFPGKKSCSELIFYNRSNEIVSVVQASQGKLVAWFGGLGFLVRPPCSGSFVAAKYLLFIFKPKNAVNRKATKVEFGKEPLKTKLSGLPKSSDVKLDIAQHLTQKFYDKYGQSISVFDGLFSQDDLTLIRKAVLKEGGFSFAEFENEAGDEYDNVQWMSAFGVNGIFNTKVWNVIQQVAYFTSGEKNWYPYDVANNVIERMGHTRIHTDCEGAEFEYTFLLYLNPNWTENMYGETVFFEKPESADNPELFEVIAAVKPQFGRVCIFRNNISHSARPPSPAFEGGRFSFVVKLSRNKKIGLSKIYREALENSSGENLNEIKDKLHEATIGGQDIDMSEKELSEGIIAVHKDQMSTFQQSFEEMTSSLKHSKL